jgi:hypothetical protein
MTQLYTRATADRDAAVIRSIARNSDGRTLRDLQDCIANLNLDAHVWRSTSRGYRVAIAGLTLNWVEVSTLSQAAALAALRIPQPAAPGPLQRLAQWAKGFDLQELRWDVVNALLDRGVPALTLIPLRQLPRLVGGTEYACKTQWFEAPLWILHEAELDARRWLD